MVLHAILYLLPALVLATALIARRYPGERILARLSPGRRPHWPRPRPTAPVSRRVGALIARGGCLLGRSLAVRPPPLASTAS
ncbi:MAG: hypothetical protein ACRDLF_14040 [Solirubrobacteraceae bacterium]